MRLSRYRLDCPGDAGFTLLELLVTIAITGVIAVPLGGALIAYFQHSHATAERLSLSHDAQISAAYFARDIAAIGLRDLVPSGAIFQPSIQVNAAFDEAGFECGTAATPVALVRFLGEDWERPNASTPHQVRTSIVAYYLQSGTLRRIRCLGSATPISDAVIAHNVSSTVDVACSTNCIGTAADPVPERVTLTFTVDTPTADAYPITLVGQRRQT